MYDEVRELFPPIVEDEPTYKGLQKIKTYLLKLNHAPIFE
jgi:hypothetical protein